MENVDFLKQCYFNNQIIKLMLLLSLAIFFSKFSIKNNFLCHFNQVAFHFPNTL